jgi:uncharacterized Zn finger protein (UPF0148 family)
MSDALRCPECGTTYLVKSGCTFCNSNIAKEEAPRKHKETGAGAREAETRANEKTVRASADRVGQMKLF